ncbi:hypothetical protein [Streptomyces sp. NPDC005476]|uniref:hypothetical protein n=1 Tax=Streptomyces sp. NPDC005476 TaxID=3156882 RepID=UPI0034562D0E
MDYFDAAEHAGARADSARDLNGIGARRGRASIHFTDALALRKPGFDRVRVMDRVGLAAALSTRANPIRPPKLLSRPSMRRARIGSALVVSRLNTLLGATRPYKSAAVDAVRAQAADLAAARPTTVAA